MVNLAPVVLFVYNRPDHTRRTLAALAENDLAFRTPLIVYCDGPKTPGDPKVLAVRELVKNATGFVSVTVHERDKNQGLAPSIIYGVSQALAQYDRVIVMEDDLVSSPYFLTFMNEALTRYGSVEKVGAIQGYMYPTTRELPETFLMRGADCWGWGTWARAWEHFNPKGQALLDELECRGLTDEFDLNGAYPFVLTLKNQIAGKVSSWAIRWHASLFVKGMLSLYPGRSLIHNIGMDGHGTHMDCSDAFGQGFAQSPIEIDDIPVEESRVGVEAMREFWLGQKVPSWWQRIKKQLCV